MFNSSFSFLAYLFFYYLWPQLAVLSAFLGPDQTATEALLATDPQVLPWVEKYQRGRETVSQTDYEVSPHNQWFNWDLLIIIPIIMNHDYINVDN